MSKRLIIEIEQEELHYLINHITEDNLPEQINKIKQHLGMLEMLDSLHYHEKESVLSDEVSVESEVIKPSIVKSLDIEPSRAEDGSWIIDKLRRELRGGWIESIFVPERIIREKSLKKGDWVKATFDHTINGKNLYTYNLEKKGNEGDSERKSAEFAIVKKEDLLNELFISFKPLLDEMPLKIMLTQFDINKFSIKENDIIDYAYWKSDVLHGKVVWKYDTRTIENNDTLPRKKQSKSDTEKEKEIIPGTLLENKTVLMVGGAEKNYEQRVESLVREQSGEYLYCSGQEQKQIIKCRVKKADLVLVFTEFVSHEGMYSAKEFCKKYNVNAIYTRQLSMVELLKKIISILDSSEKTE